MRTILQILDLTTAYLQQKGFPCAKRQARELLSAALGLKPMELYLYFDKPLSEAELGKCREWLSRRAKHEPVAYIAGKVEFFDCSFAVNKEVLIPRPETEILADKISKHLSAHDLAGRSLWDICTGSGCLGVSLKRRFPDLRVALADLSPGALRLAADNAKGNLVDVEVVQGDLFAAFEGRQADYVVCNPPYVSEEEFLTLDLDVRGFEPKEALVAGKGGLEFYARLADELPQYLKRPGKAWLEIGGTQGSAVLDLFDAAVWTTRRLEKDWAGWDRFFFLEIE